MNYALALYLLGFFFHAYCAFVELKWCDRHEFKLSLYAHIRATVILFVWPLIPIQALFYFYRNRLVAYAYDESQSSGS